MVEARYDAVAAFYTAGFDVIDDPGSAALLDLTGQVSGLQILDVACGHGRITRELARRGATVTGIDISGVLIAVAQETERASPLGVRYIHADVTTLAGPGGVGPGGAEFDVVTCNFGLSDIDDLDGAVAACSSVLRPGGRFVCSILHPCFAGGKDISPSWPATGRYFDEGHWRSQDALSTLRRQVGANHRMLSTYLNTFHGHDLWLDQIAEPQPPPQWDPAHDADRKPVYLAARFLKAQMPAHRR
jgi:2-polyprenyl-3-methyl-5-hydroxy-6-metoxy-1,4-benzoquinol methylase